jgi:putative colanic acid biosynthesis glycosyltransferase
MKKIMQINITCGVGSTGRIAMMLHDECIVNGYEARFAYSAFKPTLPRAFRIETTLQNYMRRGLNKYIGRKQVHATPGTERLIRYIEKEKPDIIHLHNVQQNCVNYILLFEYLKKKQIPIVYTLHDCWSFTGGCYHFTKLQCDQYKNGCHDCPIKLDTDDVTIGMEKSYAIKQELIGENSNIHVTCVSNWLKESAQASYMRKMTDVRTIYNGVDTSVFKPISSDIRDKLGIANTDFVILGVASYWDERKGLDIFRKLKERLSDDYKIVLVGLSEEQIANTNGFAYGLKRTETLSELVELYSCADAFINASIEETFGLTTVEAMACGTPAIVYNSTACPEIVSDDTGFVVESNIEEMARAVKVIRNIGKPHYSSKCVERVKTRFDKHIMLDAFMNLYRSILNDK